MPRPGVLHASSTDPRSTPADLLFCKTKYLSPYLDYYLFTQRKAVKRPSNVIWTAICPLLCSIRGSFGGTLPQLAVTTVTPVTAPRLHLCSAELHYAAFFLFLEDKGYAPRYAWWKSHPIAFCQFQMLALSLASHLYLRSSNLRRLFCSFQICLQ